jgi:hypothetical protein
MKFNTMVRKFVYSLENKGVYDEKYAEMILENSPAWNKEFLLKELERQVRIFMEYDEMPDKVNFNYLPFCEMFMIERPPLFN